MNASDNDRPTARLESLDAPRPGPSDPTGRGDERRAGERRTTSADAAAAAAAQADARGTADASPGPVGIQGRRRAVIDAVLPIVDGGRFAIKRCVGDVLRVQAHAFVEGHEVIRVRLRHRRRGDTDWLETEMLPQGNDVWHGETLLSELGAHEYTVIAWPDAWRSWLHDFKRRVALEDVEVALRVASDLVSAAARRARGSEDARRLKRWCERLSGAEPVEARRAHATDPELAELMTLYPERRHATAFDKVLPVTVDPVRARFSAWYELFPRSTRGDGTHGTLTDLQAQLPDIAQMGFDVLYLPPIHPIGMTKRKGPNNALTAGPDDPGSPWAIGGAEGGHKAVHPQLGTIDDLRALVSAARGQGIEVALDIAFQCSPDHPYVREHPQWFKHRPDGSVQYAENPPKKYEDIYPFDFDSEDWAALWTELESVFRHWIAQGVRVFRVDNPHTKPFPMWQWMIGRLKRDHPELIFLSEAFTRPKVMHRLAKLGYTQSYTYFAWRNTKDELIEYFTELSKDDSREYFRPNVWPNTPDILTDALQHGGRPAFVSRLVLAATLSASYGVYGPAYEHMEHLPRSPGSEEYLDSEKYQIRRWGGDSPANLRPLMGLLNRIRRDNPALHEDWSLAFVPIDNDQLIAYAKCTADGANAILVVVNLDVRWRQSGFLELDLDALGLAPDEPFTVHDLLTGVRYGWCGARNYVELDPHAMPAHVFRIERHADEAKSLEARFG